MIALDTNILVYAHRQDMSFHERAAEVVRELAEGRSPWGLPWPCVHEFIAVVTNPRIFKKPTPIARAIGQVAAWRSSPMVQLLAEVEGYWEKLAETLREARVVGGRVHDARVAALCMLHDVRELWSADRDFSRFSSVVARNPLLSPA